MNHFERPPQFRVLDNVQSLEQLVDDFGFTVPAEERALYRPLPAGIPHEYVAMYEKGAPQEGSKPVGIICLGKGPVDENSSKEEEFRQIIYIYELFVDPEHRNERVAHSLMTYATLHGKLLGRYEVALEFNLPNTLYDRTNPAAAEARQQLYSWGFRNMSRIRGRVHFSMDNPPKPYGAPPKEE